MVLAVLVDGTLIYPPPQLNLQPPSIASLPLAGEVFFFSTGAHSALSILQDGWVCTMIPKTHRYPREMGIASFVVSSNVICGVGAKTGPSISVARREATITCCRRNCLKIKKFSPSRYACQEGSRSSNLHVRVRGFCRTG